MSINNHIEGRSGCSVELLDNNSLLIRKYSKDINYNDRLLSQLSKQIDFFNNSNVPNILTPEVINYSKNEYGLLYFDMNYINGQKFSNHLLDLEIYQLNIIINNLINYIIYNRNNSIKVLLDESIFKDKLFSIKNIISKNGIEYNHSVFEIIDKLELFNYNLEIPSSHCHGDLTFSNILFKDNNIYIYDFLDSFVNSYLIDIVKLRQDTSFYWSILIDSDTNNETNLKLKQILNYFDEVIDNYFREDQYYNQWYVCLQNFNLLRILPYVKNKNEINFIENALLRLNY